MKAVKFEVHDKVGVLRLNRSTTNPLNLEFLKEIAKNLKIIKNDNLVTGLVLTGNNDKFFSIGFDIPLLFKQSKDEVKSFYETFNRLCLDLYTLPKPTVAAITGHAIAGGCILAICCDYRFIAKGRKLMGLNEIKLGIPVPYPADCIIRQLIGTRNARNVLDTGDFFQPEQLFQMGMVDRILNIGQVVPKSIEKARVLGEMPQDAFGMIKHNRVELVEKQIQKNLKDRERFFLDHWHDKDTRIRLEEAIKKFKH